MRTIHVALCGYYILEHAVSLILLRLSVKEKKVAVQSVVLYQEIFKVIICAAVLVGRAVFSTSQDARRAPSIIFSRAVDFLPPFLYAVQNNMGVFLLLFIDPATFLIGMQQKTIWAAIFSYCILSRAQTRRQWVALLLMYVGVIVVQLPQIQSLNGGSSNSNNTNKAQLPPASSSSSSSATPTTTTSAGEITVAAEVLCFAGLFLTSLANGLAGVCTEKLLVDRTVSYWDRNLNFAVSSVILCEVGVVLKLVLGSYAKSAPAPSLSEIGKQVLLPSTEGFPWYLWLSILLQASGGICCGLIIREFNIVQKDFMNAISLILTVLITGIVFRDEIHWLVPVGAVIVTLATCLYKSTRPIHLGSLCSCSRGGLGENKERQGFYYLLPTFQLGLCVAFLSAVAAIKFAGIFETSSVAVLGSTSSSSSQHLSYNNGGKSSVADPLAARLVVYHPRIKNSQVVNRRTAALMTETAGSSGGGININNEEAARGQLVARLVDSSPHHDHLHQGGHSIFEVKDQYDTAGRSSVVDQTAHTTALMTQLLLLANN
ncbi:unnamed protein product [Amoebophrya sp. A120]|nr:unnamed protein product [Amoebophrya sp. A120]|eukprot:GSA120T00020608001.1